MGTLIDRETRSLEEGFETPYRSEEQELQAYVHSTAASKTDGQVLQITHKNYPPPPKKNPTTKIPLDPCSVQLDGKGILSKSKVLTRDIIIAVLY